MKSRINSKIKNMELFLEELNQILPSSFEDYKHSIEKRAACERYVEKIVEAATDLAFLIIKFKKLKIPEDDIDAFNILLDNKIIGKDLALKLKNAKGMRNIIAHEYGRIDDCVVFEAITEDLEKDIKEFIACVKQII